MDKQFLIASLAKLTADLSPFSQEDKSILRRLRSELARWLVINEDVLRTTPGIRETTIGTKNISPELEKELSEVIDKAIILSGERPADFYILKREAASVTHIDGSDAVAWISGQRPTESLGPFADIYGRLIWYDIFPTLQLNMITYQGDAMPLMKFSTIDVFSLASHREVRLEPGSIWIRASYFNTRAPVSAFIGLRIAGGNIQLNQAAFVSGNNLLLDTNTVCSLQLQLAAPSVVLNNSSETGKDARLLSIHTPREIDLQLSFQNGSFIRVEEGEFNLYENHFPVSWQQEAPFYDESLNRLMLPLHSTTNKLIINNALSTLFFPSGEAGIQGVFWELSVATGDPNKLGEAVGCGGYLVKTGKGLTISMNTMEGDPLPLPESSWIAEPGKLELITSLGNAASLHFLLWHKTEKRSSVLINLIKNNPLKYTCSAVDELEMLVVNADLKGFLDMPLTSDGKRINVNYTGVQCSFIQYKAEDLLHCHCTKILEKKYAQKLGDELRPVSMALSNAFAKISPCDEFLLAGKITNGNEVSTGICSYKFGLYSLMPIFPDPYVSNLHLAQENTDRFSRQLEFHNYLQVLVNWKDIYDPLMSFHLPAAQGQLFHSLQSQRKNIYDQLRDRNAQRPVSYVISEIGEDGKEKEVEHRVSDIIETDRDDNRSLVIQFIESSGGRFFPDTYILDVSSKEDQFGVGMSNRDLEGNSFDTSFGFSGIELVSKPANLSVITLPPVQWEAISTIPNPNVQPKNFPSPAHSMDTGDPAVIRTLSTYELVPITPAAVMNDLVNSFSEAVNKADQHGTVFLNLPFGMKSYFRLEQLFDNGIWYWGFTVENNRPEFKRFYLTGGNQLSIAAYHKDSNPETESPGFNGATIQTRNLVNQFGDVTGLSVLGPFVDTIFNKEFRPGGSSARVPLRRVDISGYGATLFSNWRNPDAQIAATSQAKFDVLIGRTAHEIIQVKSILYCCGASLVRTITIQRNAGGGVTRHDSGWVAEGPGLFDFSYKPQGAANKVPNPFEFHTGLLKGYYNITNIRDSVRIVEIPSISGAEKAKLQEVFFDADLLVEDVVKGQVNAFVNTKNQKGFVQLEPSGKPISEEQLTHLLKQEGPLGGPVDCLVNIGRSGQEMRVVRVDTNPQFGSNVFVNALRGSLVLNQEGNWGIVQQKSNSIQAVQQNAGIPLIRYNPTPTKYQFTEPAEDPSNEYGLIHSSNSHRVLFSAPYITHSDPHIHTKQPAYADIYALLNSNNIFPPVSETFPVGAGPGKLKVHANGLLELVSQGKLTIAPGQRKIYKDASFASYIEYFDKNSNPSQGFISINPGDPEKWKTEIKQYKHVYDIGEDSRVKLFHLSYHASGIQPAKLDKPSIEFGSSLKSVGDMLRILDKDDLGEINVDSHNIESHFKYKISYEAKIEFELHSVAPFYEKKIHFWPAGPKKEEEEPKLKYYGIPAFVPPFLYFTVKVGIVASHDEKGEYLNLKLAATLGVQVGDVLKVVAIYAVGIFEYKAKFGTSAHEPVLPMSAGGPMALAKEHSFKMVFGCAFRINLFKIGEIEGMRGFGIEYNTHEKEVMAILTQKAEITIATCSLGVTIEAKAPVGKVVEAVDPGDPLNSLDRIIGEFELTLIIEMSAAYVINFEYEYTWKELNKVF
jgi:hypothetical protein